MTSKRDMGKIVNYGMGGFLNPPTHPEHTRAVQSLHGDTFFMSLSAAVESEWLDAGSRLAAKSLLDSWQSPAIESPEVQDWIRQVLGYFRGCYQGENGSWHAGELKIVKKGELLPPVEQHAGVHLIRKYYPEFEPTAEQFEQAFWGTKVSA